MNLRSAVKKGVGPTPSHICAFPNAACRGRGGEQLVGSSPGGAACIGLVSRDWGVAGRGGYKGLNVRGVSSYRCSKCTFRCLSPWMLTGGGQPVISHTPGLVSGNRR